jgi:hypothetical protein
MIGNLLLFQLEFPVLHQPSEIWRGRTRGMTPFHFAYYCNHYAKSGFRILSPRPLLLHYNFFAKYSPGRVAHIAQTRWNLDRREYYVVLPIILHKLHTQYQIIDDFLILLTSILSHQWKSILFRKQTHRVLPLHFNFESFRWTATQLLLSNFLAFDDKFPAVSKVLVKFPYEARPSLKPGPFMGRHLASWPTNA